MNISNYDYTNIFDEHSSLWWQFIIVMKIKKNCWQFITEIIVHLIIVMKTHNYDESSSLWWKLMKLHRCEEGGALTPSKDESRGKLLCFRVQVHVRPRTKLAIWLGDKNTVKQTHYKIGLRVADNSRVKPLRLTTLLLKSRSY